jgi:hypothetical protein
MQTTMALPRSSPTVTTVQDANLYDRHRAIAREEPLILAHGTFECVGRNRNVVVRKLETLGRPLARRIPGAGSVVAALPNAHHFGHR